MTVPFRLAEFVGIVTVCALPALTAGGWLAATTETVNSSCPVNCVSLAERRST